MSEPLTLALEAATAAGTIALLSGSAVIAETQVEMRGTREPLLPAIHALLRGQALAPVNVTQIACGAGPGSFTSLRVSASLAKGLAAGLRAPLIATSSLLLMVLAEPRAPGRYLPVLDALRGEVFTAAYELRAGGTVAPLASAALVPRGELAARARTLAAIPIGPGEESVAHPHARAFAALLDDRAMAPAVELAAWEPEYGRVAEAQARWERAHGRPLEPR